MPTPGSIHLFGDPEENFYQLGLQDKTGHEFLRKHLKAMMISRPKGNICPFKRYRRWVEAYSEGLGVSLTEFFSLMTLPEFINTEKKSYGFPLFACSSAFVKRDENIFHGRVIDSALVHSYTNYERELIYDFKDMAKIWTIGTAGFPLPCFQGVNEFGLSIALHAKTNNRFYAQGTHIFEIVSHLLFSADTLQAALRILKTYKSRVKWGLYMAKDNQVLEIDIFKNELESRFHEIKEDEILYFNNEEISSSSSRSAGLKHYNSERKESFAKAAKKLKGKEISHEKMLDVLGTPIEQKTQFRFSPLTPSSVGVLSLNLKKKTMAMVSSGTPRWYQGHYLEKELFATNQKNKWQEKKSRKKYTKSKRFKAFQELAQAQFCIDHKQVPEAFYHIQMAIALLKNCPEQDFAHFFFLVLKSTHLTCKKELALTLVQWKRFTQQSTSHLRDHAYLFINRLEIHLGFSRSIRKELIRNPRLQFLFLKEKKLSPSRLKNLMDHRSIRIDHGDVYYFY